MKKSKKGFYIVGIIVALIVLFALLFFMFGGKLLKLKTAVYSNEKTIEVNYKDDNFKYPKVECEFLGSKVVAVRNHDVNLAKLGSQEITYKCKKFTFEKEVTYKYNIIDTVPPEIKLNGDVEISLYVDDKYEEKGATATDNVDGDITDKIVIDGTVDVKKEGTYELTYTITDSSNLTSSVKRSVIIKKKPVPQQTSGSSLGCGEAGVIYLTFDDGPNSTYTPIILDVLKKYNVKATFFVTSAGPDELIKREFEEGHAIGLHSSTHDYAVIYKSSEAFWQDMNKVASRVTKITGEETTLLRFPGGVSNTVSKKYNKGIMTKLAKEVQDKGYAYFDWNISSGDAGGTTDPKVEYQNVVGSLSKKKGNVVLMHDIKKHTSQAIEDIIKYGLDNGYTFKVLTNDVVCHQKINN